MSADTRGLRPVRTTEQARELGRRGGLASARARAEKKSFAAMLRTLMDMPMEELGDVSPRLAICRGMIMKAASGDRSAAEWVRDTLGEKPVVRKDRPEEEPVVVVLFSEG